MTHAVNASEVPVLPSQEIYDNVNAVYGKWSVEASYNVAGDLVTVTLPDHQFTSSEDVVVEGANDAGINGTYPITVVNADSFTYTPTAPPANPDNLADVPLEGDILVGQEHISYTFRMCSALMIDLVGATVEVQVKTAPYQPWFSIVATVSAISVIEFPVPYNFLRVKENLPSGGPVQAYAQGVYAQSLAGSPI